MLVVVLPMTFRFAWSYCFSNCAKLSKFVEILSHSALKVGEKEHHYNNHHLRFTNHI